MNPGSKKPESLRILTYAALTLGCLAMFAGSPSGTGDLRELASIIEREEDHVSPQQLASMIMNQSGMFRLIDIRDSVSYAASHIRGAEHVGLSSLLASRLKPLETLVLYSDGGIHASQAWILLKARGLKNVYTLRGGLDLWRDSVLHPVLPSDASREERDSLQRIAAFFGGSLSSSSPLPKIPPASGHFHNAQPSVTRERERTRDGC